MTDRKLPFDSAFDDFRLRSTPNWTAVVFCLALSGMHVCNVIPDVISGRWEASLSLILAVSFGLAAIACHRMRFEVAVLSTQRVVRTRTGIGRLAIERCVPFSGIRSVRLTVLCHASSDESRVELLCGTNDIDCPLTSMPRQQALILALAIGVPLVKVISETTSHSETSR